MYTLPDRPQSFCMQSPLVESCHTGWASSERVMAREATTGLISLPMAGSCVVQGRLDCTSAGSFHARKWNRFVASPKLVAFRGEEYGPLAGKIWGAIAACLGRTERGASSKYSACPSDGRELTIREKGRRGSELERQARYPVT